MVVALPLVLSGLTLTRGSCRLCVCRRRRAHRLDRVRLGRHDSIAITAVLGSQFAAIAAVVAFFLFGERLSRIQVVGVVLIVGGVTVLAATSV